MEIGLVQKIDINGEMQQAYLDYAMSVIVARALPDARDGLKPVHRRILYAMYDMGLRQDSPYKKSARIVGEVLGKYHPHGDMAVYEAMARMAQNFSMRYLLVDGQGNFGSVDGDPPAAMRYTEARLGRPSFDLLSDIHKDTVDFQDNFDGTLQEPTVLPAALPNLLVNGATGIAVGMATSIPPHNLGEVVSALQYLLNHWEKLDDINVEDLMRFVPGPDFPTGGVIVQYPGDEGLISAYGTGRGRVTLQASAHLEEMERGRSRIIVTELPFMTNKSALIERIAELTRDGKIEGVVDLRDESDRQGMRIVIELSKTVDPSAVLRDLYKHTPMQVTFSIILLALVDGEPRLLSLKQALRVYLEHRLEVTRRRAEYDLEKARQRAHILEGLRIALQNLDEVIELIRKSSDADVARTRLMKRFQLSQVQAQAILDMPLRRLAALERKKIEQEYKEVQAIIKDLENLLRSPKRMRQLVSDELQAVKEAYGDRRRTHLVQLDDSGQASLQMGELIAGNTVWVVVTRDGMISRTADDQRPPMEGDNAPYFLLAANQRHILYLAATNGEAAAIPVHAVPQVASPSQGAPLGKVSPLSLGVGAQEGQPRLAGLFTLPPRAERSDEGYVLTASRQGLLKKTVLADLPGPSANAFTLVKVNEGDALGWVRLTDGKSEVLLATERGMAIRFDEGEIRPMGLNAAGVMGIKLLAGDKVAGLEVIPPHSPDATSGGILILASDASAKRLPLDQFPQQGRYGQGVTVWKLPTKAHLIGLVFGAAETEALLHFKTQTPCLFLLGNVPLQTRIARGIFLTKLAAGDSVVHFTWSILKSQTPATAPDQPPPSRKSPRKAPTQPPQQPPAETPSPSKPSSRKSTAKAAGAAPPEGEAQIPLPLIQPAQEPTGKAPKRRTRQSKT